METNNRVFNLIHQFFQKGDENLIAEENREESNQKDNS